MGENLVFASPFLLLVLNFIFLTLTGLAIAIISAKSYLAEGQTNLLLLGMATGIGGLAALVAGFAAGVSVNDNVTIFNLGFLISGSLQALSAVLTYVKPIPSKQSSRRKELTICYVGIFCLFVAISVLTLLGYTPAFFTSSGPTLDRDWVIGITIFFFLFASLLFAQQFRQSRSDIIYWYSLALALLTLAIFGSATYTVPNGLFNWIARISQYIAGIYFLITIIMVRKSESFQTVDGLGVQGRWADAFRSDHKQWDTLFGKMLDGFSFHRILCDGSGKPIDYVTLDVNDAFERMTGLKREEVVGRRAREVMPGIEKDPADWIGVYGKVALTGEPVAFENYSEQLKKWYNVSAYSPKKGYFITLFVDVTGRKEAEKRLSFQANLLANVRDALAATDENFILTYWNRRAEELLGWTSSEVLGRSSKDLLQTQVSDSPNLNATDSLLNNGFYEGEVLYRHKNGSYIPFEVNSTTLKDPLGEFRGSITSFQDITERRRMEEETRRLMDVSQQERDRLTALVNSMADEVWFSDTKRKFTLVNPAALKEFADASGNMEMDAEKMAASIEVFRPDGTSRPVDEAPPLRALRGEVVRDQEEIVRTPATGELRYRQVNATPVRDSGGNLIGSVSVVRDITEHKRAEEALQRSEEQYRTLFERMDEGFAIGEIICDDKGKPCDLRYLVVNPAFERQTGIKAADILGKTTLELFPNAEPEWFERYGKVALTGEATKFEGYFGPLDRWFEVYAYQLEKGKFAVIFTDTTERKKMEEELKESYRMLERRVQERTETIREQAELLDKANDAIIVRDLETRTTYWNKGAERIYGWTSEEVLGKKTTELLQGDPSLMAEALRMSISTGQWSGEFRHSTKDGRIIVVESRWTLVTDERQKPRSVMEINTDVTERKNLEAQYLRAQRLESLGTLAGGIAHDFRNILTPITITLGLIDQHLTEKEDHEMMAALLKNLQRGGDLAKQLLTFTRGAEGEHIPINVPELIFEIEKTVKETFPRSIHIETEVKPDLPDITGDSTQLHQVLINMCINARDAMPFGGTLTIAAEKASLDQNYVRLHAEAKIGPYVVISVMDNGTGMPPEVLDRLFEPFFTTKRQGEGTGLGLPTARSIVKSHGGFINVYSEVGKGTTFKIYLPVEEEARIEQPQKYGKMDLPQGSGQTILIVDDEELIRITTKVALQNYGYRALEASDGAEALGLFVKHREQIKAVLVDMVMPIMDGEATIRALRKIDPGIKIIGMSGLAENGKYKAMHDVANAFIEKPFTAEKLLKSIAKVVGQ
jgi:hypothetical protein